MLHWTVSIIGIAWILLINNDAGLATVVARSRSLTHSRHLQAANAVIVGVNESTRGRFNSTLSASSPYIEGLAWFTGTEEEAPSGRVPGCAKVFQSIFDQIDRNSPTFSLDVQEALQQLQQEQSTDGKLGTSCVFMLSNEETPTTTTTIFYHPHKNREKVKRPKITSHNLQIYKRASLHRVCGLHIYIS